MHNDNRVIAYLAGSKATGNGGILLDAVSLTLAPE